MSDITIEVPAAHASAVRDGLRAARGAGERQAEIDRLLAQLAPGRGARRLSGPRELVWDAVYGALGAAADQLADDCAEHWRAAVDLPALRARHAAVGARLDLLAAIGDPPPPG